MSEPTIWSVLREFDMDSCEGGAACDEVECVGARTMAHTILDLRTALTLTTQRAEAAEAERDRLQSWYDGYMKVADAICASSAGPKDLADQARALRAERDALRTDKKLLGDACANACAAIEKLEAERDALRKDAMGVVNVLGFFASCIKSGEAWTPQCEEMLRAAFAHIDAALAVQPSPSTETTT